MHHKRINRLSALELAVLDKIREINGNKVIEAHPKDVEVIRNKVIGQLCDEDRNFARYYMAQIVKDMRTLHRRRGLPDKSELPQGDDGNSLIDSEDELEQQKRKEITELEGNLFQLFKKLCQFIESDKKQVMLSIDDIIEIKNAIKSCMEDIIDVLLLQSGEVTSSKGLVKE